MAVEPRPTWQTVVLEQVQKMPIWQLKELSEARKRDQKAAAEKAAATQQATPEQQPTQNNSSTEENLSNPLPGPTAVDSSTAGPSRPPRKSSRNHPYSRPGGSKDSSSKDTSETNPHPTSNGAPPSMSEAGHDDVHQQSVQEAMALIARLRKKLNELEEENRDVLQTARDARVIAARLKEKLAFERAKTDKVVNFLTTWQKTHAGFKFDEHFPSEGRSESEYAIDQELGNETLSRLKRDFEGVLTKRQFSQLKRRLAQVERKKKSRNAKNSNESHAVSNVADDQVNDKGKGKEKGKGQEHSDNVDAPNNSRNDKGKGKAKENPQSLSTMNPNSRKRLFSEFIHQNPEIVNAIEEIHMNTAIQRSRNDMVKGSSSGKAEASGSRNRLPEASGSGTRLLGNVAESAGNPITGDEEPSRKRRKVHWEKLDMPSPKESSTPSFLAKSFSFGQRLLERNFWPGIPDSNKKEPRREPTRGYLSIIKLESDFNDAAKEPVFTWDPASGIPDIQLPEPNAPNYISEIQRACRFLLAGPPDGVVPANHIFRSDSNATLDLISNRWAVVSWDSEDKPVFHLPDVEHPGFLRALLSVGLQLGDYDPAYPCSSRRVSPTARGEYLHCNWDHAGRPVIILSPPEDPKHTLAVRKAARFILRGPGPENGWRPSMAGFFKKNGRPRSKLSRVSVTVKDGNVSVELPHYSAHDYMECILSAEEWLQELLGDDENASD